MPPTGRNAATRVRLAVRSGPCRTRPNDLYSSSDSGGLCSVTTELIAGVFTALGALIAAGATFASGFMANRVQRGLAAAGREAQIAETRREAYAAYLIAVYSFMDRARELIAHLGNNTEISECDAAYRTYHNDWETLHPTYASVLIAGPDKIEGSAEALRFCLGDLADKCDRMYSAYEAGKKLRDPEFKDVANAQQAARDARQRFSAAARHHVYG
jgi:hypothetical protein